MTDKESTSMNQTEIEIKEMSDYITQNLHILAKSDLIDLIKRFATTKILDEKDIEELIAENNAHKITVDRLEKEIDKLKKKIDYKNVIIKKLIK
jgi:hypothetical protein